MPVQLPPIQLPGINLPPQPADPPDLLDVHRARLFCHLVENHFHMPGMCALAVKKMFFQRLFIQGVAVVANQSASADDVANAQVYFHRVVHAVANQGQPGPANQQQLLQQVVQQLNNINQHLHLIDGRLDRVDQHLDRVDQRLDRLDQRLDRVDGRLDDIVEVSYQVHSLVFAH